MSAKAVVVDDSRAVRVILARTLRELNYEVAEAGNGLQAIELLNREGADFELALVDWNMPEMNGLELLKHLRADSRYDAMRVLMVTTETEMEQMETAILAGANEYVMKPFTREILIDKLQIAGARV
jgi:two-component system chemotaxis response regulator CheY